MLSFPNPFASAEPQYEPLLSQSTSFASPLLASMAAHSAIIQANRPETWKLDHLLPLSSSSSASHNPNSSTSRTSNVGSSRWNMFSSAIEQENDDAEEEEDDAQAASDVHLPFSYRYRYLGSPASSGGQSKQPNRRQKQSRRPLSIVAAVITLFSVLFIPSYMLIIHFVPHRLSGSSGWPTINTAADPLIEFDTPSSPIESTKDGVFILSDPSHVLIPKPSTLPPSPHLLGPMSNRLPLNLLDYYYTHGLLPLDSDSNSIPNQNTVDLVYLFVNASSPYFQAANQAKGAEEGVSLWGKKKHWRDNGELRGALRSGAISLAHRARTLHVISGAYDFDILQGPSSLIPKNEEIPDGIDISDHWQIGQVPAWLEWNKADKSRLRWHFHPEIYRLPRDEDGSLPEELGDIDEEKWRKMSLPTFNSFEIETRIPYLKDLSEQYILSNDDMFILRDMSTADFHHPLFGTVIRLDPSSHLLVNPVMPPNLISTGGEWGGLQHASSLISSRFPHRSRMYMHHLPKAQSLSLAQEASVMFASALTDSSTRSFRESKRGKGDVEMAWLVTHTRVERWREALLWSWVVAKVGGEKEVWGEKARDELRELLGLVKGEEGGIVRVERGERKTLEDLDEIMRQAGWESAKNTKYTFSSFDGHLPSRPDIQNMPITCDFSILQCLPENFFDTPSTLYTASEIFTNFTFINPSCGDCLINALVRASGSRGLSAFLPDPKTVYRPEKKKEKGMWEREEPMLPLVQKWQDGDFSMSANVRIGQDKWLGHDVEEGVVNLRAWCIKLLSRYAYVFGSSPAQFSMIHGAYQLISAIDRLNNDHSISMVCMNDDQGDNASASTAIAFGEWMKKTWGEASRWVTWEREGWSWL